MVWYLDSAAAATPGWLPFWEELFMFGNYYNWSGIKLFKAQDDVNAAVGIRQAGADCWGCWAADWLLRGGLARPKGQS